MRNNKQKQPNAFKHGIFSQIAIAPGESAEEFAALYSTLVEEWKPSGATEEDAVLSIAKAMWRKRRAQMFIEIQLFKNSVNPEHPSFDEHASLMGFIGILRNRPDVAFKEFARRCLRADKIELLTHKFPRSAFSSTQEWAEAVINEIETVLLPETDLGDPVTAQLGSQILSSATFTDDFFNMELRLDERLEIMIDRAVKRLIQIKAMKQILGQTSAEQAEDRVSKIAVKRAANG